MSWLMLSSAVCAALGYLGLALWRLTLLRRAPGSAVLVLAFAATAIWCASLVLGNIPLEVVGKMTRDLGWFGYLFTATRGFERERQMRRRISLALGGLAALAALRIVIAASVLAAASDLVHLLFLCSLLLGLVLAIAGLFFVHLLHRALTTASGSGLRLSLILLGVLFAYDTNLATVTLLGFSQARGFMAGQGIVALLLLPLFALAARRKDHWTVMLSRKAATSSALLLAVGTYFVVVSAASRALVWAARSDDVARILLALLLAAGCTIAAFSPRIGRWAKALALHHFFEHRYDYRVEWLRFSATIGDRDGSDRPSEERVIRSVADVTESPCGLLLLAREGRDLAVGGSWNWHYALPLGQDLAVDPAWLAGLAQTGRVVTLDEIRAGHLEPGDDRVPRWLLDAEKAWAGVPLVRGEALLGLILLGRPAIDRPLDWEDFDLLKVIGQQVAMHLADAQSQAELEQARQFEEFNRRFAFIIHDIKNVVSQLSLVSSNAAEHGANPRFQEAMAKTLASATEKMMTLLSRLSAEGPGAPQIGPVDAGQLLADIAAQREPQHAVTLRLDARVSVLADREQLRQALDHLVQNAIDASPRDAAVALELTANAQAAQLVVRDKGAGMSPEFVRQQLFKPFASTKKEGFGIGAAEARALIEAMGGKLGVESVVGSGTAFTITLARSPALADALAEKA